MVDAVSSSSARRPWRLWIWLGAAGLVLAALVFGLPWWLYSQGLKSVQRLPQPPAQLLSSAELTQVWQRAGLDGEPAAAVLDPVSYLASAAVQARPPAVTAFAWRIASEHLRQEARPLAPLGPLEKHLAGASLTIWLTRHWSLAQLLSRAAELERAVAMPAAAATP